MNVGDENLPGLERLIGKSRAIREVKSLIRIASQYDYPIIISGETGVGKTLVAQLMHSASTRKEKRFLHMGCSNIPSELFESELFGHEKGAFTGAIEKKIGKLELADGGTLFLDEISDLSAQDQAKLLLFMDTGKFFRVGGTEEIKANVRILAASNRDLKKRVKGGRFREDLYFRLSTAEIYIPALRERREDFPLLIEDILKRENKKHKTDKRVSSEAMGKIMAYDFPGNVRELENIIKRGFMYSKGNEIKVDNILNNTEFSGRKRKKVTYGQAKRALCRCKGNKSRAARELRISRQSLYKILKH